MGTTSVGELPAHVRARASFGPETHAQAANLLACHVPIYRSTILLAQMAGIKVSSGWMASVRGKAAALVASSGFMERVTALLRTAQVVHVDEAPARAAGGTRYVHLARTRYLSHLHTGTRSADDIDAGGVLPGYSGIIVRDGYAGYAHLTDATQIVQRGRPSPGHRHIGIGLGKLVGTVTGPADYPVGFASFVAPALLATSAMNGAILDSTFNVFFRLKYEKFYDAALATPMRPGDIALGEVGWALIRGGLYAIAFMMVMLAMGLVQSAWAVADVPVALLIGFGSAAAGMAATTFMRSWSTSSSSCWRRCPWSCSRPGSTR